MQITLKDKNNQDKQFELDVEQAKHLGLLKEVPHLPLKTGDVYIVPKHANMLLVKCFYEHDAWILLGACGLEPFGNAVHQYCKSLDDIKIYLRARDAKFSHNINRHVAQLLAIGSK